MSRNVKLKDLSSWWCKLLHVTNSYEKWNFVKAQCCMCSWAEINKSEKTLQRRLRWRFICDRIFSLLVDVETQDEFASFGWRYWNEITFHGGRKPVEWKTSISHLELFAQLNLWLIRAHVTQFEMQIVWSQRTRFAERIRIFIKFSLIWFRFHSTQITMIIQQSNVRNL